VQHAPRRPHIPKSAAHYIPLNQKETFAGGGSTHARWNIINSNARSSSSNRERLKEKQFLPFGAPLA